MYGILIANYLAHGGGARVSKGFAITIIYIVVVHHAHETDLFSLVSPICCYKLHLSSEIK